MVQFKFPKLSEKLPTFQFPAFVDQPETISDNTIFVRDIIFVRFDPSKDAHQDVAHVEQTQQLYTYECCEQFFSIWEDK